MRRPLAATSKGRFRALCHTHLRAHPRPSKLEVDGRALGSARDVDSVVQAELSRQQVPNAKAPGSRGECAAKRPLEFQTTAGPHHAEALPELPVVAA